MYKIILLFAVSVVLTAVFSYSLQFYLRENFIVLTLKTMLIPCFTWSVLILLACINLSVPRRKQYFTIAGWVCAIGSALLVPGGLYNYFSAMPDIRRSFINVFFCVAVMSGLFFILLKRNGFPVFWWWAFNILICVNMILFYWSAG